MHICAIYVYLSIYLSISALSRLSPSVHLFIYLSIDLSILSRSLLLFKDFQSLLRYFLKPYNTKMLRL